MLVRRQKGKSDLEDLLAKAAILRVMAQAFAYPQVGYKTRMLREFAKLKKACDRPGLGCIAHAINSVSRALRNADDTTLRAEYFRLFLGNGPVLLHEAAYGDGQRIAGRPHELADISGFYSAFGLRLSDDDPNLPDHLSSELEFYSLLLVKQAYADRGGQKQNREVTRRAAKVFLEYHLGRWVEAFAQTLRENEPPAVYRELAHALQTLIRGEIKRSRVRPFLASGRLPHDVMQEDELVCPMAASATTGEDIRLAGATQTS
ncbi:MAG TPA: molecular chaperone TorD family protein [Burkholderiales bacterium]|nr:molecular chaperone TorD family protein [Burkholderiales bacterium]